MSSRPTAPATPTTAAELDPVIHAPTRFAIVALLAPLRDAEFGHVRDTLDISDSALSKQLSQLEDAGYVDIRKGYVGKRPRTWVSLSKTGRAALAQHLAALKAVIAAAEQEPSSDPEPESA